MGNGHKKIIQLSFAIFKEVGVSMIIFKGSQSELGHALLHQLDDEIIMLRTYDLNNTFYNEIVMAIEAMRLTPMKL